MPNNQLTEFAVKVQENLISKQNAVLNENKEINAKLHNIEKKIDELNRENNLLQSRLGVAGNTSTLPSRNHHKNSKKILNVERDLCKMEQYSRQECIKITGIPPIIRNSLLEEHILLIFSKIGVNINELNVVACCRHGSTKKNIVKLLNRKDAVKLLENKNKLNM